MSIYCTCPRSSAAGPHARAIVPERARCWGTGKLGIESRIVYMTTRGRGVGLELSTAGIQRFRRKNVTRLIAIEYINGYVDAW